MISNVAHFLQELAMNQAQCAIKSNDEFKANVSWSKNTLNNYMYPTEGVNNSLNLGYLFLLGTTDTST